MGYRIGCDIGGTFTDFLLLDEGSGETWREKVPSTPADPSIAVSNGLEAICSKAGIAPSQIAQFFHGTTVATNAVLQHKIAKVGLVTTAGFRQILQIGRSYVPGGLAGWIIWPKPEPLAPLESTIEAVERTGADGAIVIPLDEAKLRDDLLCLKSQKIDALTICFINSYVDGSNEVRAGEIAAEIFAGIPISLSHQILPEMQEYERALTTVTNSAVGPVVADYIRNLTERLDRAAYHGRFHLLRSDGGLMSAAKAQAAPVNLLMSGPAGGVAGAVWIAKASAIPNVLTLDVGGTSTDVALIENYVPRLTRDTSVGDLTVRSSSLDVKTVGAGGGSIAYVPELTRALRVGPESAGAVPGPACYQKGGTRPTVTDANVVLGYLPADLLGGSFHLDREAAKAAVQTIADAMGVSLMAAAQGIISVVNENMNGALRLVSVQQGYDPRDFALMGFGGAGSLHSNAVAKIMGSWPVIVPVSPGVLCAQGDATTRVRHEMARSFAKSFPDTTNEEVVAALREMSAKVSADLVDEGVPVKDQQLRFEAGVRYKGQGSELSLPTSTDGFDLATLGKAFDAEHKRMFDFTLQATRELLNLRVVAMGQEADLPLRELPIGDGNPNAAKLRDHEIWVDNKAFPAVIYDRAKLRAGDRILGAAIVTEMDSTALILPDHVGTVDRAGNILIRPV
ncbi:MULTISPECIES: hydantoinase/oxoprolinase family protein [unclassified Sphingomonas]|uniref:hydantoinase/oxoprolinase family protein n=1 Tax=unclassified Sphingomonas TaxID=196159 RepID=UPI00070130F8|nr:MULTISPECIES: hydantoinase/oxoprolinase family protein [unclassified Sphingomonas]KQX19106.1 5-oxoprolinase [Sphingomonas sp. Root1294]KQY65307.1 5-oxoprolinase [Sphingomonas sp. Root50]KRB95398.1 5-oxoprolinase [Sphingomonas sp. Root720]